MMVSGYSKDFLLDKGDQIVEVEEPGRLRKLLSEVKRGRESKTRSGKALQVQSLTRHGKFVAYEATKSRMAR